MVEAKGENSRIWDEDDGPTERDLEIAEEIARFIAARAFQFEDHECRAWSLTDFEVWATLAGREPELRLAAVDDGAGESPSA